MVAFKQEQVGKVEMLLKIDTFSNVIANNRNTHSMYKLLSPRTFITMHSIMSIN